MKTLSFALTIMLLVSIAVAQYGMGGGGGSAVDSGKVSNWGFISSTETIEFTSDFDNTLITKYSGATTLVYDKTNPSQGETSIVGGTVTKVGKLLAYQFHVIFDEDAEFILQMDASLIPGEIVSASVVGDDGSLASLGFRSPAGNYLRFNRDDAIDADLDAHLIVWVDGGTETAVIPVGTFTGTAGSIPFSDGTSIVEDNANLFWNDTDDRLGIGTTTPATILHVAGNDGITVGDGTAADQNIFVVDEGTADPNKPTVFWDESDNEIESTVDWAFPAASITIGTFELSETVLGNLDDIYAKSTGLIKGGAVSINGGDNTLIDITAGSGQVVNSTTDPDNPSKTSVVWGSKTGYNLTTTASAGDLVTIFLSLDSGGNVIERSESPTAEERRNTIDLGIAARNDADQIVFAGSGPKNVIHNPGSQVQDFMEAWGTFNVDGNQIQPNAADDLQIKKTEGSVFRNGANFQADGKNPHVRFLAEQAPVSPFNYKLGDGTDIASASYIDPNSYDDGTSVPATVPNNQWTVQHISVFASGVVEVLYGQEVFTKEGTAITALANMDFTIPVDSKGCIPLAYLLLKQGDASLPADRFYRISRAGTGGGSVSYWNRTGTDLSPATDGDNVIVATQTELSAYPNFSADPGWTIFSGNNTWTYDGGNDRMKPTGELTGNTIANTGIALTSGKTYVISLSWLKSVGSCQIYQGSAGTQISDYIDDGTLSRKWIFTASADENLFVRTTSAFHDDATTDYISALSVIEIDNAGDVVSDRLALGGTKPEDYSQLDSYDDAAIFFPPNKGILTISDFEIRNINTGGLDFDETYARPILSAYGVSVVFGSNGYATASLRADSNINLRTYADDGAIVFNESSMDTDFILNGSGAEAYKYDAGDATHVFTGNVGIGGAPTSKLQVVGLSVYANNAAAITGGLTVGAFYRTGADPDPVCVVH